MNTYKTLCGIGFIFFIYGSLAHAGCKNYTDSFGNTSIRCPDGTTGQIYTDQFGNTAGHIGDQRVNTHRDSFGNTTGTVGDQRQYCYTDSFGNTSCR